MANRKFNPNGRNSNSLRTNESVQNFSIVEDMLEVATGSQELGATVSGSVRIFSPDTTMEDLVPRIRGLLQESYSNQDISESLFIEDSDLDLTTNYMHEEMHEHATEEDHFTWSDCGELTILKG